jgi:hypothetical protein
VKRVVIYRGLPGSGKDYDINKMLGSDDAVVCSADDYFMVEREVNVGSDGDEKFSRQMVYEFDPTKLPLAHAACMTKFLTALKAGIELVILSNTNTQKWEYENYVLAAELAGYDVDFRTPTQQPLMASITLAQLKLFAERNQHGVPVNAVVAMALRWED